MEPDRPLEVIVAGAGIAGLTAALAFAARGHCVRVFERSEQFREIGAGLQLSPNATRILDRLGVLGGLETLAVRPPAIILRDAGSLRALARVPLGAEAESRWKAPYLVVHRADLQKALLSAAAGHGSIRITTGATVQAVDVQPAGITATIEIGNSHETARGMLAVGADGVWSNLRRFGERAGSSRFSGHVAWRRTLRADSALAVDLKLDAAVNAFLHSGFHLVAYPLRAGSEINLVAFTPGKGLAEDWSAIGDPEPLRRALGRTARPLAALAEEGAAWTAWPVHTADMEGPWTRAGGFALIGDAAHAITPFAAQGAAMAIEDADTLAAFVAARPDRLASALSGWEALRRPRIRRVAARGSFNRFVWHAAGPAAAARDLILRMRRPERLAADFDWLYGWDLENIPYQG